MPGRCAGPIRARLAGQALGDPRQRAGAADCERFDPGIGFTIYAEKSAIDRIPSFKGPVLSAAADAPPMPARAGG